MPRLRRGIAWVLLTAAVVGAVAIRRPLARKCLSLATAARSEWRLGDSIDHLDRALLLAPELVEARIEAGHVHVLRGEFDQAIRTLRRIDSSKLDDLSAARHGFLLGTALFQANEASAAMASHERSLRHARRAKDRLLEGDALVGMSRVLYHTQGNAGEARRNLELALHIARTIDNPRLEGDALRHLAVIRWWFDGERESPIALCGPALAAYRRAGDLHGQAVMLTNLGLMCRLRWDVFRAMQFHAEGLAIKERIGDRAGMVDSWGGMGDLYAASRNYRKARESYLRAAQTAQSIGYRLAQNELENKLADIYATTGELDAAVAMYEKLAERERGNPQLLKYRTSYLADLHLRRGDPDRALRLARRTLDMDAAMGRPDLVFRYSMNWMIAEAHRTRGDLDAAHEALKRADTIEPDQPGSASSLGAVVVGAEIFAAQGLREKALRRLSAAADREMSAMNRMATPFTVADRPHYYDRLFLLLLGPDGDVALAVRFLEQLRYRSLLDVISRTAEPEARSAREYSKYEDAVLRSKIDRPQEIAARTRPRALDEIQRAIAPGTAIVAYVVAARQVFAIVITQASVRSVPLPIPSEALSAKARLLRALMFERPSRGHEWVPVATDLRRVLIEPLERAGSLDGIRRLEIVPWGALRELPFAALVRSDGSKMRFLVEDFVIAWLRSASMIVERPVDAGSINACFGVRRFAELPELPAAEDEARRIAARIGAELRVGTDASETELARIAPRARAIHFATHAVFEPDMPLLSRLMLTRSSEDDGKVTIPELLAVRFPGTLVTLGACRTGISSSWSGGEESEIGRIGLVEAALHAGARSVVASLAPVSDRSTARFMTRFYGEGVPADAAERVALTQRGMLDAPPRDWAAFVAWR